MNTPVFFVSCSGYDILERSLNRIRTVFMARLTLSFITMIYSNIIYLLIVMVILATSGSLDEPQVPVLHGVPVFLLKVLCFWLGIRYYQQRKAIIRISDYFAAERIFSVLALVFFALDVYLLDLKYYLGLVPFGEILLSLSDMAGVAVFMFYLAVLWLQLRKSYTNVFGVRRSARSLVTSNLKFFAGLVLPWFILNLTHDLLQLVPSDGFGELFASSTGEALFFIIALVLLVAWYPALLVRMFGCKPMADVALRSHIEDFCRRQGVRFKEICIWPLFEGRVLTAGVLGMLGSYRYLMITPALLESLSQQELDAVVAHEVGHVKKRHILLYLLIFLGFMVVFQLSVQPLVYLALNSRLYYELLFYKTLRKYV